MAAQLGAVRGAHAPERLLRCHRSTTNLSLSKPNCKFLIWRVVELSLSVQHRRGKRRGQPHQAASDGLAGRLAPAAERAPFLRLAGAGFSTG